MDKTKPRNKRKLEEEPNRKQEEELENEPEQNKESRSALRYLFRIIVVGLVAVPVYGLQTLSFDRFVSILSVGVVAAGAFLFIGGILGFLFGIPRTLQTEGESEKTDKQGKCVDYKANTNLEQISDWLTKMLVGVGLTQLTSIPKYITSLAKYIATGLGNHPADLVFAMSLILFYTIIGFLYGYLWTRLYLALALKEADLRTLGSQVKKQVEYKIELDNIAINLLDSQLRRRHNEPDIPIEKLTDAFAKVSPATRERILNKASWRRNFTWRNEKKKMARTIPIFRALIKANPKNLNHDNHGQLGFALKDLIEPDWKAAEIELTKAIEMREDIKEFGALYYEFNRALCRINLDEEYLAGQVSSKESKEAILADLKAACQDKEINLIIEKNEDIQKWMKLNNIAISNLDN